MALSRVRALSAAYHESRPDVAEVIAATLAGFCTAHLATRLVDLAGRDAGGRAHATAILGAIGPCAGAPLLDFVRSHPADSKDCSAAVQLLCDHAAMVAPALVAALAGAGTSPTLQRTIARVLGFAGHGH